MDTFIEQLKDFFHQKILLYRELTQVLEQEKQSLVETNVDALWGFSDKKQTITKAVTKLRTSILKMANDSGLDPSMTGKSFNASKLINLLPKDNREELQRLNLTLITLKSNVHEMSKANKQYVEEYLNVLDEMLGLIANVGKKETTYGQHRYLAGEQKSNLILHREV